MIRVVVLAVTVLLLITIGSILLFAASFTCLNGLDLFIKGIGGALLIVASVILEAIMTSKTFKELFK